MNQLELEDARRRLQTRLVEARLGAVALGFVAFIGCLLDEPIVVALLLLAVIVLLRDAAVCRDRLDRW